jgi:hypothetical protein
MKKFFNRGWTIAIAVWLLTITCNLPSATTQVATGPTLSAQDLASTAVALTIAAQQRPADTSVVPSDTPTTVPATISAVPTTCVALVTARVTANVRSGPGTAYDVIGGLPVGGTANVFGQNDAKTWWYIEFPSGSGQYAWVAGSVTAAACLPPNLQIVAAPPLPTAPPTAIVPPTSVAALPDLYVSEYSWLPVPPHMGVSFHIRVGVYNQGNANSGAFTVQWWLSTSAPSATCTWNVPSMAAHGGRILECDYTPAGWANYPSQVVVDPFNNVGESNESNNTTSATLQIKP